MILKLVDLWEVKRKPSARANAPPNEAIIIYDESSSPSADYYIIDAEYPIVTYLNKKNTSWGQSGELYSNLLKFAFPLSKIDIDSKAHFA